MERTIQLLVEYDNKGQELVREAQEHKLEMLSHLDEDKNQMYADYQKRLNHRIEAYRQQALAERDDELVALRRRYAEQSDKLKASYQENSARWVGEIIDRCISG